MMVGAGSAGGLIAGSRVSGAAGRMSEISGFKRPLQHTNSFSGSGGAGGGPGGSLADRLPPYGVPTATAADEAELGGLLGQIDQWGVDIFRIGTLSGGRPLTAVAYTVFQVTLDPKLLHAYSHLPSNTFSLLFSLGL